MANRTVYTARAVLTLAAATVLLGTVFPARGQGPGQARCERVSGTFVSVQGEVEVRSDNQQRWLTVSPGDVTCHGDMVRVGEYGRAGLTLLEAGEVIRLDQNTTVRLPDRAGPDGTVQAVSDQQRLFLDLFEGVVQFFSNKPKNLDIRTPYLNAGVEGTEFLMRADNQSAHVLALHGRVSVSNPMGQITLTDNQAASARAGMAPVLEIPVAPRDAVRWALFYPPVQTAVAQAGTGDVEGAARQAGMPRIVMDAIDLQRQGRLSDAIGRLEASHDPSALAYRAGLLLSVGRRDEARRAIERLLGTEPRNADALALSATIAVVDNDQEGALLQATRAVDADPDSVTARLALSYAHQAAFDLPAARSQLLRAIEINPDDALSWARLSELQLSLGYRDRAIEAAQRAVALAPDLGRTQTVLGFAALSAFDTQRAIDAFRRAMLTDTADPLPRLGHGLALIRSGDLAGGREQIEIATGLAPGDALVRSYVGKAYAEENRSETAGEQLMIAKGLDPQDPTPFFYHGLLKQSDNRPIEALQDINQAIALNDNRAVYRSRLLLDEDLAVRSISQGRIYRDLGFEELAETEATESLTLDPANASAHRFLADAYAGQSRHDFARVSELLQSRLLQPLHATPIQPRLTASDLNTVTGLGPAEPAFNEFTPLFLRDGVRFSATGLAGSNNTYGAETAVHGLFGRYALSAGQFHYETDGFRQNNDLDYDLWTTFGQAQLTESVGAQLEFRRRDYTRGDIGLYYRPDGFSPFQRSSVRHDDVRAGLHVTPAPGWDILSVLTYGDRETEFASQLDVGGGELIPVRQEAELDLADAQVQVRGRGRLANLIAGVAASHTRLEQTLVFGSAPEPASPDVFRFDRRSAHAYVDLFPLKDLTATLGVSFDRSENGVFEFTRQQWNPKFGLRWAITDSFQVRAAAFRTLRPNLFIQEMLEPTQVAGFTQMIDDTSETSGWTYGIGFDAKLGQKTFAGAEARLRRLERPFRVADLSIGELSTEFLPQYERYMEAYLYRILSLNWAIGATLRYDFVKNDKLDPRQLETISLPLEVRYFSEGGLFASFGANFLRQNFEPGYNQDFIKGRDEAVILDAAIGFRLPNRRGLVSFEVHNLLDTDFRYQDHAYISSEPNLIPDPRFQPERTFLVRVNLNF